VGHKEFASINMLLYELFHPDRGDHPLRGFEDVVLLFPHSPGADLAHLLSHPAYAGHVTYLEGSPLQEKDLRRAHIGTANGVIVLANKDSDQPQWHDGELLTAIQAMKAFWLRDVVFQAHYNKKLFRSSHDAKYLLRPRIVAQVLLPETKEYLVELPGWTVSDVVVVCSEYVAWMTAMASVARGMATVLFNLTSHTEVQHFYQTKWYPRYESGATQEIYCLKVKTEGALHNISPVDACKKLLPRRVILIAFERREEEESGPGVERDPELEGLHLFPGPEDFRLQEKDRLFCIAQSNPALQHVFKTLNGEMFSAGKPIRKDKINGDHSTNTMGTLRVPEFLRSWKLQESSNSTLSTLASMIPGFANLGGSRTVTKPNSLRDLVTATDTPNDDDSHIYFQDLMSTNAVPRGFAFRILGKCTLVAK
jgi:hypothetical protein